MTARISHWQRNPGVSRRRALAGMGSTGLAGLFLAACGGSSGDSRSGSSSAGTNAQPGTGSPSAAVSPVRGGTLKVTYQTPIHFDPFITGSFSTHQARSFVSDKLITFAQGPEVPRGARVLKDQLAQKWESPDGLSWTFQLRPGVKFHNGRALTAEDARWSFERGMDPKAFQYSEFRPLIKSVTTPDAMTLKVELTEPFAPFLQYVASDYSWIVARESGKDGDFRESASMVGTGPFILKQHEPDRSLVFQRNPDYFVQGQPLVDGVEWTLSNDVTSLSALLLAGNADNTGGTIPREQRDQFKKAGVVFREPELGGFNLIYMRADQPPFTDVRVRRAVALAVDREGIIKGLFGGEGEQSTAIPPWWPDWWVHPSKLGGPTENFLRYNLAEAKQLLSAAGVQPNFTTKYHSTQTAFGISFNQLIEVTQRQINAIGIKAELALYDYAQFTAVVNTVKDPAYDGMAFSPRGFYTDISGYLTNMHYPGQSRNYVRVNDPALNAMLDKQQRQTDMKQRQQTIIDIQKYLALNPYYVAMPCEASAAGYSKRIGHVANWGGPIGGYDIGHMMAQWWIKE
jgi:peptide/nickel transport system substrate-binding protein